jgi:hypothetical protein
MTWGQVGSALSHWWPVMTTLIVFVFLILINIKYRIPDLMKRVSALERYKTTMSNKDMIQVDMCKWNQEQCRTTICKKMDDNKKEIVSTKESLIGLEKKVIAMSVDVKHLVEENKIDQTKAIVKEVMLQLRPLTKGGEN